MTGATRTAPPRPRIVGSIAIPSDVLVSDIVAHTVRVHLVAGAGGINERLNFNGVARGARTIVVPLGWRVSIHLTSEDPDLSHSALVIPEAGRVSLDGATPAFAGAATADLDEGIDIEGEDDFSFVADRPGRFLIVCAVADHGESGQWIRLRVSSTVATPAYQ
ncbi:MAG: hypothetical protein NVS4B3_15430 [Gemmatimonadaceae bacterium]